MLLSSAASNILGSVRAGLSGEAGVGRGVTVPPLPLESPPAGADLAWLAARQEHRRREAAGRRRRRRRRLISLTVLVLLSPAIYSYATTMLQPIRRADEAWGASGPPGPSGTNGQNARRPIP